MELCELCQLESNNLTKHHLIPRTLHSNKWFKQRYTKEQLHEGIMVDRDCHNEIHKLHDNKHLAKVLNTLDKLRSDEKIAKYVSWKKKRYNKHG